MTRISILRIVALIIVAVLLTTGETRAHCDTMTGPVVEAGKQALERGDVRYALVWVRHGDEPEIRSAFARTIAVRARGDEARALADRYFFETLVRVHRSGEGAPYTGLKEVDVHPEPGIVAAEHALQANSPAELSAKLTGALQRQVDDAFQRVQKAKGFAATDVEAGRRYVEAYVHYIHYIERLHQAIVPSGSSHTAPAGEHEH